MYDNYNYPVGSDGSDAPYNQSDPEPVEVNVCISQTLHKSTTISTTDYVAEECEDCERDDDGEFVTTGGVSYNFSDSDLLNAYKNDSWTIPELLYELKDYIKQDLNRGCSESKKAWLERMMKACEGWELDEEEVIKE